MASISNVTLTITASVPSRSSDVTVEYDIVFDESDIAVDQPYRETVRLVKNDTGDPVAPVREERLTTMVPGLLLSPSAIPANGNPTPLIHRTHIRKRMSNIILDENKPPIPNPDKIRVVVLLEPFSALVTEPTLPRMSSAH